MHRFVLRPTLVSLALITPLFMLCSGAAIAAGPTGLLNDTGQTQCNNAGAMVACNAASTGDTAANPRQDGRFGRDVALPTKVGGGAAGFDFTRVCQSGQLAGSGSCPVNPPANNGAAPAANDWACTQDNVTNLVWSLESGRGNWTTYARTTLPNATNTANRCGYSTGWRLPTRRELLSIVHLSTNYPAIDTSYFPNTQSDDFYWTNDLNAPGPSNAWGVHFSYGFTYAYGTTNTFYVRLVRSGQ